MAKIAEQAERYDGRLINSLKMRDRYQIIQYYRNGFLHEGSCKGKFYLNKKKEIMLIFYDQMGVDLTVEERNLLSVAYKNVIGARRASWRIVSSIEQKEESKGHETQVTKIKEYRNKIENELYEVCADILALLSDHLIPAAGDGEAKVFYYKM